MKTNQLSEDQILSFYDRMRPNSGNSCWIWTGAQEGIGARNGRGYGFVKFNCKKFKCHRLSLQLSGTDVPDHLMVCHTCDNPPCCNPLHLFVGTAKDNTQDCIRKGRAHKESGEDRYNAILTNDQVAIIKAEAPFRKYGWGRATAKKFGVCPSAISNIVKGLRWKGTV